MDEYFHKYVICINLSSRFLYLTTGSRLTQTSKIERALLDGSNRTVLVSTGVVLPTSLSVDLDTGDIFWTDAIVDAIQVSSSFLVNFGFWCEKFDTLRNNYVWTASRVAVCETICKPGVWQCNSVYWLLSHLILLKHMHPDSVILIWKNLNCHPPHLHHTSGSQLRFKYQ